jgi:hypothetical protein
VQTRRRAAREDARVPSPVDELPHVDAHATVIAAGVERVWSALIETIVRTLSRAGAARYARVVGCDDDRVAGPRPLAEGSSLPGFHVVSATEPCELVLAGRHRFSSYALIFRIDELSAGRSRLDAETRANFPGVRGAVYRTLVIGTGGHRVAVRRLLSAVARAAESP